jgi:CarD family transcriptional regulator
MGEYYVIELYANRLTMLVPVGNADTLGLRLADSSMVDEALRVLVQDPAELPSEFKSRQKDLMDKLRSGDTRLIAEVCRDLYHRSRASQLTSTDARVLEQARNFVATELAAVRGCEPEEAFEELASLLDGTLADSPAN